MPGVNVPSQYQGLLQDMSSATGIPYAVEAAQAEAESGFSPTAVSNAGAEGWLQFLPTTYTQYASQVGVAANSEFDPASEEKVYVAFMNDLLKQEKGNLRDALAAYNAGTKNISAGYGYADAILQEAGVASTTKVTPGSATTQQANTAGIFSINNPFSGISVSGVLQDMINTVLALVGLGSMKDLLERAGLIILGFVLVIVGIEVLSHGSGGSQPITVNTTSATSEEGTTKTTRKVKHPFGTSTKTSVSKSGLETGAGEAAEAAAVA